MVSKIRTLGHVERQFLTYCFLIKLRETVILVMAFKISEIVLLCCKPI